MMLSLPIPSRETDGRVLHEADEDHRNLAGVCHTDASSRRFPRCPHSVIHTKAGLRYINELPIQCAR